jgi:hypothetical protein
MKDKRKKETEKMKINEGYEISKQKETMEKEGKGTKNE